MFLSVQNVARGASIFAVRKVHTSMDEEAISKMVPIYAYIFSVKYC